MHWSKEEINILINNYGIIKNQDILRLLPNRNKRSMVVKAHRLCLGGNPNTRSINRIKYDCNAQCFNKPNINNCYWAGYIAADGHIETKTNLMSLFQAEKDIESIFAFKKFLNYSGPISKKIKTPNSLVKNPTDSYGIRISNVNLKRDLIKTFNLCKKKQKI